MTTSEPTTGEIVRAFRGAGVYGITTALELRIIDRLESQERTIAKLTSRLESAEAERDAAKRDIEEIMAMHGLEVFTMCAFCAMPDDDTCFIVGDSKKCKAKWRGLQPQEGEGK